MQDIKDIQNFKDQEVNLAGWVANFRSSGKIAFLELRDGTGYIQAIISKNEVSEDVFKKLETLTIESSVKLKGIISEHPKQPGIFELQVSDLEVINISEEYPIGKKEHGPDFLLDNRHLWLRSKKQVAILKVRNTIINATYNFFEDRNFTKIDSPILTPNACEGTTTLFEVPYFDLGSAYLSQTGQLYLEAAIAAHRKVFDFGPVFRAEKSKTRRHLTEFWIMDAEMAFVDHEENMKFQEELVCYIIKTVLEKNKEELKILERDVGLLEKIKAPFTRMTHAEAVTTLQKLGSNINPGDDLGAEDETMLTKDSDLPIFVEKWPKEIKAFYMKRDPKNSDLVLGSDLIATEGFGELIGGSQREDDHDILLERIKKEKLPLDDFQWYLDLRKYGSVPHSGFGYGLERVTAWITGTKHVRETIPFPRMITRLKP